MAAEFDVIHYRKNGTPIWLEIVIIPVTDANGATMGPLSFARELKHLRPRMYARNELSAVFFKRHPWSFAR